MFAFLPSLIYFVTAPLSVSLALWLGFAGVFAVCVRAFAATGRIRIFDLAGLILFAGLALYDGFVDIASGPAQTSLILCSGLLAAAVQSMAVRRPFTSQYGWLAATVAPDEAEEAHTFMTSLWATCFAAMIGLNAASVVFHRLAAGWANALGLVLFAATLIYMRQLGARLGTRAGRLPFRAKR